jgi:hypothetical protein
MQPMSRRFGKEFFQGDALSTYQQLAFGLESLDEGFRASECYNLLNTLSNFNQ